MEGLQEIIIVEQQQSNELFGGHYNNFYNTL
mgnify:FL=1